MKHTFTTEEKAAIVATLKRVAVAQAEFWDILRDIEEKEDGLDISPDVSLVSQIAGECNRPPDTSDLDDASVWEAFEASLF